MVAFVAWCGVFEPRTQVAYFMQFLGDSMQANQNLQAPWLGLSAFFVFSIMLALLVFIFEGLRDAFDPRKTFS